mmetsp:Transcript_37633/g.72432  ORF Transcript_37633/g.72432 Transcript_37633/m.72432 type:complete len:215 (+) Transcript_37633:457-1101(+)
MIAGTAVTFTLLFGVIGSYFHGYTWTLSRRFPPSGSKTTCPVSFSTLSIITFTRPAKPSTLLCGNVTFTTLAPIGTRKLISKTGSVPGMDPVESALPMLSKTSLLKCSHSSRDWKSGTEPKWHVTARTKRYGCGSRCDSSPESINSAHRMPNCCGIFVPSLDLKMQNPGGRILRPNLPRRNSRHRRSKLGSSRLAWTAKQSKLCTNRSTWPSHS